MNFFKKKTKVLVLSDSHGRFNNIYKIAKKEKPDYILFAGDVIKDIEELQCAYDKCEYFFVRGNCDISGKIGNWEEKVEIDDRLILLTHGHRFNVKSTYNIILKEAERLDCEIAIFGHTHEQSYEILNGVSLFNPGAAKDGDYGIIELEENDVNFHSKHFCKS